jgi:hypothetical protein
LTLNHFSLVNEQEKEQTKIRFYWGGGCPFDNNKR